jgi:hypothetical protein
MRIAKGAKVATFLLLFLTATSVLSLSLLTCLMCMVEISVAQRPAIGDQKQLQLCA